MIGIPEQTQNGIRVRCLLNPNIKIGQIIKIEGTINQFRLDTASLAGVTNANIQRSNKLNGQGLYYVMYAQHTGDTRGNPWYTDLICLSVDATVPNDSVNLGAVGNVAPPINPNG